MISGKDSLLAKPVTSEGLAAQPNPLSTPLIPSRARSVSRGRSSPACPHMSAVSELMPPEWETTATPFWLGLGRLASRWETSSNSS